MEIKACDTIGSIQNLNPKLNDLIKQAAKDCGKSFTEQKERIAGHTIIISKLVMDACDLSLPDRNYKEQLKTEFNITISLLSLVYSNAEIAARKTERIQYLRKTRNMIAQYVFEYKTKEE